MKTLFTTLTLAATLIAALALAARVARASLRAIQANLETRLRLQGQGRAWLWQYLATIDGVAVGTARARFLPPVSTWPAPVCCRPPLGRGVYHVPAGVRQAPHRPPAHAGSMRVLDLELTGPVEVLPGIVCESAGAHTEGSMNILVETADGTACICGDVIYDIEYQVLEPHHELLTSEACTTGNHALSKRHEKAASKKVLNAGTFLVPMHDYPARIEQGRVVARLDRSVPGVETPVSRAGGDVMPRLAEATTS